MLELFIEARDKEIKVREEMERLESLEVEYFYHISSKLSISFDDSPSQEQVMYGLGVLRSKLSAAKELGYSDKIAQYEMRITKFKESATLFAKVDKLTEEIAYLRRVQLEAEELFTLEEKREIYKVEYRLKADNKL